MMKPSDHEYYEEFDHDDPPEPQERYWQTRDGRKLLPREMETAHMENILNLVMRNAQIKLLCRYIAKERERDLILASSPARMRTQLLLISPILRDIEAEVVRRRMKLR